MFTILTFINFHLQADFTLLLIAMRLNVMMSTVSTIPANATGQKAPYASPSPFNADI